jgi:hypothetical protein
MLSGNNGFIEISSVLVNPEIFTRPYTCDVVGYDCKSLCCYRACLVSRQEARRIETDFDEILSYLSPERREVLKKNGSIVGDCQSQCPAGCEVHENEAQAVQQAFQGKKFCCVLIHDDICSLLFRSEDGVKYCAVHAHAIDKGLVWHTYKFADCVQYPLAIYSTGDGKTVLSIQDTPFLDHIPCISKPKGEPMYRSLRKTIETFMGTEFYKELETFAERKKGISETEGLSTRRHGLTLS